ncbi:hypothetical protein [Chryseobacterium sp. Leaf405]|uniref:hypothetical protein n=1 Tax=Chryseobacterium sp. Leaf405 TaxID=1736367 RepID=UPI000B30873B|nr:hypothetical protein [Chryseobacterium sp. Leaf405]
MYYLGDSLKNNEIIKKYNLKIIENSFFFGYTTNNYKDHFSYEDIFFNKTITCDSGYVTTLKSKKNDIYQFIDLKNNPMLLQVYSKGKRTNSILKKNIQRKIINMEMEDLNLFCMM